MKGRGTSEIQQLSADKCYGLLIILLRNGVFSIGKKGAVLSATMLLPLGFEYLSESPFVYSIQRR